MIVREQTDGTALLIAQEGHADVAAQVAAHWGNDQFPRLDPYETMVFGTVYHDSGHREMEAKFPIDPKTGLLYNFRGAPSEVRNRDSDSLNSLWLRDRDTYAGLVVSMHHTGLRKRRYDTVSGCGIDGRGAHEPVKAELAMDSAFDDLQGWQTEVSDQLGLSQPNAREAFWRNYRMLQVFDLLSLYFCCDGYEGGKLREWVIAQVPVSAKPGDVTDLHLTPVGPDAVAISPYPFDTSPLELSVMARQMKPCVGAPAESVKEAYHRGARRTITWHISKP